MPSYLKHTILIYDYYYTFLIKVQHEVIISLWFNMFTFYTKYNKQIVSKLLRNQLIVNVAIYTF